MFDGGRVSVGQREAVLEADGGEDCTEVWTYFLPLNGTVKMVDFMLSVSYHHHQSIKLQDGCESNLEVTRDFDEGKRAEAKQEWVWVGQD